MAPNVLCGGQCVDLDSNAAHCGSCGHDCQGGLCQGAICQPVTLAVLQSTSPPGFPYGIAVDAMNVYWANYLSGTVMQVGINGGTPIVLASSEIQPRGIAVDSMSVFWMNQLDNGAVKKVAIGGGNPTMVFPGQFNPYCIALRGNNLYWYNNGPSIGRIMKGQIFLTPLLPPE